jgi:bifunctional non-homologous end joining protein LigD
VGGQRYPSYLGKGLTSVPLLGVASASRRPSRGLPFEFDDSNWIFELKYDGFRALAVIENGRSKLISRNGHPLASFADLAQDIRSAIPNTKFVLDGENVCVDKKGKPQFRNLLFPRGAPCFFAFDLLTCDGKDWRTEPLIDRKQELRRLLARVSVGSPLKYTDTLTAMGRGCFSESATWI